MPNKKTEATLYRFLATIRGCKGKFGEAKTYYFLKGSEVPAEDVPESIRKLAKRKPRLIETISIAPRITSKAEKEEIEDDESLPAIE